MLMLIPMNETVMLENFPLLIPSKHLKSWKGHILLSNVYCIYIEISCLNIPKLDNVKVCIPEFENFNLNGFVIKEAVDIIKKKTHTLPEFLNNLISVLSKVWKQDLFSNFQNLSNSYLHNSEKFYSLIQEVNIYGPFIYSIDENLKHITFNVIDICKRNHFITIYIPDDYPMVKKKMLYFETMVPPVTMNSLLKVNTVLKLFEEFKTVVDELNSFWNVYEELIGTCNIIGPYTYKDINYKIPIDSHVCVEIEIDPLNPYRCPKFDLHGQPRNLKKFQLRLNEINPIFIWSVENSFKENILEMFDITELHSHYTEDNQENVVENQNNLDCCFICYDQLDMSTKKCDNEKCDSLYHMACICEWLLNSGSTPMFKHLQGKCPQCEENILVALDNFDLIKT